MNDYDAHLAAGLLTRSDQNEVEALRRQRDALLQALQDIRYGADCERRYPDDPNGPAWESIYQMAAAAIAQVEAQP